MASYEGFSTIYEGFSTINVLALAAVCRFLALRIDMHRRAFIALGGAAAAWRRDVDTALVCDDRPAVGRAVISNTLALCEALFGGRRKPCPKLNAYSLSVLAWPGSPWPFR
jgi:hypothetical protein